METTHIKAREPRHRVALMGSVRHSDGRVEEVRFKDISFGGCSVDGAFNIGELVTLSLPKLGDHEAKVRWAVFDGAGFRFTERLHLTKPSNDVPSPSS